MIKVPCSIQSEDLQNPNPDIHELFAHYNKLYFDNQIGACTVKWSSRRMTRYIDVHLDLLTLFLVAPEYVATKIMANVAFDSLNLFLKYVCRPILNDGSSFLVSIGGGCQRHIVA